MKDHLDWIEVRGILRQIAQACADCLDGVFDAKDFVGGRVVHHHNVSALERRSQTLLEVGQKDFAVHCSVDQHRRDYSGETQARNKGHGLPVAQWHISDQALPGRSVRFPALHPSNRRTRADLQLFGGLTPRRSRLHKSNDSHSHLTGIRSAHGPPPGESMRVESVPGRPLGIPDSPRPENPLGQPDYGTFGGSLCNNSGHSSSTSSRISSETSERPSVSDRNLCSRWKSSCIMMWSATIRGAEMRFDFEFK